MVHVAVHALVHNVAQNVCMAADGCPYDGKAGVARVVACGASGVVGSGQACWWCAGSLMLLVVAHAALHWALSRHTHAVHWHSVTCDRQRRHASGQQNLEPQALHGANAALVDQQDSACNPGSASSAEVYGYRRSTATLPTTTTTTTTS